MHKIVKRMATWVGIFLLLFALPVFGKDLMPDLSKTDCAVSLSFPSVTGGEFTLYHVASVKNDDNDLSFDLSTTDFAMSGVSLDNLDDPALAQTLTQYAKNEEITGAAKPLNESGFLTFSDLSLGLYLLVQTKSVPRYYDIEPFLVSVPQSTKDEWIYEVDASPKAQLRPAPITYTSLSVKKTWADDGENRPTSVRVQLLRNEIAEDVVELSDQNNWRYTWEQLDDAYDWSVKEIDIPKAYTPSYRYNGTEVVITNTSTLIYTGQANQPILWMAEIGIALFIIGWILAFARKKQR